MVWATDETDPARLRARAREILETAGPNAEVDEQEVIADAFLATLFGVGRTDAADAAFVAATEPLLSDIELGVYGFLRESRNQLLQEFRFEDQWQRALERRSAVQFLQDIYGRSVDTEDVDDLLRERGDLEGFLDTAPEGVPASHWWWTL
jgi:hypothetical protein